VWACTNHYSKGWYVADHVFDPEAVVPYCGAAAILKKLVDGRVVELH